MNHADTPENQSTQPIARRQEEWRATLTPEQYHILREKGTERAFTGRLWNTMTPGVYRCAGCGAELFVSGDKFLSECGWPAFSAPARGEAVSERVDTTFGMKRTEITCARCGGHLGHVFDDGPPERGGLRYCVNSASLTLEPTPPSPIPHSPGSP